MTFTIRNYSPGDEEKILAMFSEVFGQKRSLAHWHWKYRDNPYGSCRISLAVTEDGILASHYAGYPVKICSFIPPGKPVEMNSYQLGDKMTKKAYRSIGFGKSALISRAYEQFKESYVDNAVPFCYGFAAHHSLRFGINVLKYADMGPVPFRRISLRRLKKSTGSWLRRIFSPARVTEVHSIESHWTDFFHSVAADYKCLVKRDAPYLTWRYLQRPDRKYLIFSIYTGHTLTGWSVFFREDKKLIWGDALFRKGDSESVKVLLNHVSNHKVAHGTDTVECWFPPSPQWWGRTLEEIGFEKETDLNDLHFTLPIYHDLHTVEMIRRYFYYTIGDSDLF
jgi:hypothetical protein